MLSLSSYNVLFSIMKKVIVSMVIAFSALVMLNGCIVSDDKLRDKVT